MRVVHLSSVHLRSDARIFIKQCRSLARHGYEVTLVVADGNGDESKDGVRILDVGRVPGRLDRMLNTTRKLLQKAVSLDAAIYHLHDPELIPVGLKLLKLRKKVIFDSHEDVPSQIRSKPYLGTLASNVLPAVMAFYERHACSRFSGIVAATPHIRDKFLAINRHTVDVGNFPVIEEFDATVPWTEKRNEVCYVGGINAVRGIREIVRACELLQSDVRLNVAGRFDEPALGTEVRAYPGWRRANELGYLDRRGVRDVLSRSMMGLVTLHPTANYLDALPIKMFEYMASGIPVVASNFPLWREIVEGNRCGLCVDPLDPRAIATAIDFLANSPDTARRMGEAGREAVLTKYNWSNEEKKLCGFYAQL